MIDALREDEAFERIVSVSLDLTRATRTGLIDGVLKMVIAHPLERFAETTIQAMAAATNQDREAGSAPHVLAFDIYTAENV